MDAALDLENRTCQQPVVSSMGFKSANSSKKGVVMRKFEGSLICSLTLAIALTLPTLAFCQSAEGGNPGASGKDEYQQFCSPCHGMDGRGEPARFSIAGKMPFVKPTNLTLLAHYNHGVFPDQQVTDVITGKKVGPHGARSMPLWGNEFTSLGSSSEQAQARVNAIVAYIKSIQEK